MSAADYIRFLVATSSDPDLKAALRRASSRLRSVPDLVTFAHGRGFRFAETDVPVDAARSAHLPANGHGAAR